MSMLSIFILVFIGGVILNAIFAGYETGFVSTNPIRVQHMAEQEKNDRAKLLLFYLEHPDRVIILSLLGTSVAVAVSGLALSNIFRGHELIAAFFASVVFLFFGELLPKSMFRAHPTSFSMGLLPLIRVFEILLRPVLLPIIWISRGFLRLVEADQRDIRNMIASQQDVRVLVDESAESGQLAPEEQEMIHSIMDLQKWQANEAMVPRIDIKALPETATRAELVDLLRRTGHTRIPIFREDLDDIIGVVSVFSVLAANGQGEGDGIQPFIREVLHVPDTMKLDDVMSLMRENKQRIAVVTDEYGGTDGLITMEDILEEIFGEIHDEHDKAERSIRRVGPNAFVIDARTPLDDVSEVIGAPIEDEEVETIGGWLTHQAGRIPQKGEVLTLGAFQVTVLSGKPNFVSSLRLEIKQPEDPNTEAAEKQ